MFHPTTCATLSLGILLLSALVPTTQADEPEKDKARVRVPVGPLEDEPQSFVPLHPRTVADQREIEALQDYAAARSLEDRRMFNEAIDLLKKALEKDPDSLPVLRRLSWLCLARGQDKQAIEYSRRAIEADPNETSTIRRLERYYERQNDANALESLLTSILANPKLDKKSAGYLLVEHDLGMLYRLKYQQLPPNDPAVPKLAEKAADAFAEVVKGLDEKGANRLSVADQKRILGDEANSYLAFGETFLQVKRHDLAVKAFQHGLVYDPDHPQLPFRLAEALLQAGRSNEALEQVEQLVKQHPPQREPYDLLARTLIALGRKDEVIPRLEALVKEDPKNSSVQYVLAERYGEAGQREKAAELFTKLIREEPILHDFGAVAAWYLTEKKTEPLIHLLGQAVERRDLKQIEPTVEKIASDRAYAAEMLETGLKMLEADPPRLTDASRKVLAYIATKAKLADKYLPIVRLVLKRDPNPSDYADLVDTLGDLEKYAEAVAALEEMLAKYPNRRNYQALIQLGRLRSAAGQHDAALEALREAEKLEPNNPDLTRMVCFVLEKAGKYDEALERARGLLKLDPANPDYNILYGYLLTRAGKEDDALAFWKDVLERYPNNDDLVKLARSNLSIIYVNRDDYVRGEAELEILYQKDPDDAGVNNDLGYLYADQGKNLEKAEAMIRKAVSEDPDRAAYLDSLGWVLFKRGRIQEALEPLEKAASLLDGADPTIQDHLGDVYFQLKQYGKARKVWEKAEKLAAEAKPPDKRLPEIRKKLESLKKLETAPQTNDGSNP
jgi:tetratricopeptide (TPR) repeat protein